LFLLRYWGRVIEARYDGQMGQMDEAPSSGSRVAFFGGSFDPPHQGHLAVARAARAALALDTILFAPVGAQPLKPQGSTASFEDRLAMTRLAIAGEAGFAISLIDAPRPSAAPNYTLDTLVQLRAELPPGGTLFCLMGADSFLGLRRWHRAAEIPFVAPLIIASRPGQPLEGLRAALPPGLAMEPVAGPIPTADEVLATANPAATLEVRSYLLSNPAGETAPLYLLPGLHIEISASQIRDLIREQVHGVPEASIPQSEVLPIAVLDYIRLHGLYR
jgi:nicotinate-nucleotide adenylyltransferase